MIKEYLNKYTSNTLGGSSNQYFFGVKKDEIKQGRVFYKIFCSGEYHYSLLFSNIIDSTYANGLESRCNMICKEWTILGARIGRVRLKDEKLLESTIINNDESIDFFPIYFNGKTRKTVKEGEVFSSDPICLYFEKDEYLCVEISFTGEMIPCHKEIQLPTFIKTESGWMRSVYMPVPNMVGCNRKTKGRIAFLGDSITQGIGVKPNSYLHWNALLAEKIGMEYSFWNLGIGFGRASDAATNGVWLKKATQNDIVFLCYGVNDLCQGASATDVKSSLKTIVDRLKETDTKVVLQTVPPFDYDEDVRKEWVEVNRFILEELANEVAFVFDVVPILRQDALSPHRARYNGHPNEEGCALWAEALYKQLLSQRIL